MSRGAFVLGARGGHGNPDAARCPVCREPARLHNAGGSVRADSDCTEPYGGANVASSAFPAAVVPTAASPAPADGPAAVETPRRTDPRPAAGRALVPAAVVGGGDAVEEVAADPVMTGPTATDLPEPPAAVGALPAAGPVAAGDATPAATLDQLGAFLAALHERAYYLAERWYCPSCAQWGTGDGPCPTCAAPMQPIYLATVPREVRP